MPTTPPYPSIPEPTVDPVNLRDAVLSIKQFLEILTGQRGSGDNAAWTAADDAPSGAATPVTYGRKEGVWEPVLPIAGGTMTGAVTFNNGYTVTSGGNYYTASNAGLEIGNPAASNTPFVDFHSSGNNVDYDARIIASGGNATQGNGNLQLTCATATFSGAITATAGTLTVKDITVQGVNGISLPQGARLTDSTAGGTGGAGRTFLAANNDSFDVITEAGTQLILGARYADQFPTFKTDPIITAGTETLTVAQQTQARMNVYAAPYDARAHDNLIINGGCELDQQNGGAGIAYASGSSIYPCDQWVAGRVHGAGGSVFTASRGAGGYPIGPNYVTVTATTAQSSFGTNDYQIIGQYIEGLRCNKLFWGGSAATGLSVGFWVYASNATGTATLAIRNSAGNRSYVMPFTIPTASLWTYITGFIPGDQAGTWLTDTGMGLSAFFCFGCGSAFQGTPSTWLAGNILGVAGQTNFFASNSNAIALSGFSILPAYSSADVPTQATAHRLIRPYQEELTLAQRYWQKLDLLLVGFTANSAGHLRYDTWFYPEMRATPTVGTITAPGFLQNVSSWTVGSSQIDQRAVRTDLVATAAGVCYMQSGVYSLSARY